MNEKRNGGLTRERKEMKGQGHQQISDISTSAEAVMEIANIPMPIYQHHRDGVVACQGLHTSKNASYTRG